MKFDAIIFDLDGTLLNTLDDISNSMNAVLERAGLPVHETEKYKYFVGDGVMQLAKRVLPADNLDEVTVKSIVDQYNEEYSKKWADITRPYKGIPELLVKLHELEIKAAILSNKPDEATQATVSTLLKGMCFDVVFGQRDSVPRKPDPTGAIEISKLLDIPAAKILYLGDTAVDMKTANSAGMFAVGALWGFREAEELLGAGARTLIREPLQLLSLL